MPLKKILPPPPKPPKKARKPLPKHFPGKLPR